MGIEGTQGCAHHQWIRFADEVGLDSGGRAYQRGHSTCRGDNSPLARPHYIGISGNETRPGTYEADGAGDAVEAIGGRLAQHYVLRLLIGQNVADVMQCRSQPGLTDGKCPPTRSL